MIQFYKGRQVTVGQKVRVYFNLHKMVFSILAMEGEYKGKVVAHTVGVNLDSPTFLVNEKGRQRVLQEQKKNVHAYVEGSFAGFLGDLPEGDLTEVTYNPYKMSHFSNKASGDRVDQADRAVLINKKVWVAS